MITKSTQKFLFAGCALLSSACIIFSLKAPASTTLPDTNNSEEIIIEETTTEESTLDETTSNALPQSNKGKKDGE